MWNVTSTTSRGMLGKIVKGWRNAYSEVKKFGESKQISYDTNVVEYEFDGMTSRLGLPNWVLNFGCSYYMCMYKDWF